MSVHLGRADSLNSWGRKAGCRLRDPSSAPARVEHPLVPVVDARSRVLVLGTMPSPVSRAEGFYYAHPQNRFWRVLAKLFSASVPQGAAARAEFALAHGIALWDVLASCQIEGASDASISDAVPNDLGIVLAQAPIERVFTTGRKAHEFYRRFDEPRFPQLAVTPLPSTSAANARMGLEDLVLAYAPLKDACLST